MDLFLYILQFNITSHYHWFNFFLTKQHVCAFEISIIIINCVTCTKSCNTVFLYFSARLTFTQDKLCLFVLVL